MKVADLIKSVLNNVSYNNIIIIRETPKVNNLPKGHLALLTNNKNQVIDMIWFEEKNKKSLRLNQKDSIIAEKILKHADIRILESKNNRIFYNINYKKLTVESKKYIKQLVQFALKPIEDSYTRFEKFDKTKFLNSLNLNKNSFEMWANDNGFSETTSKCITKAYSVAESSNDIFLKKRATLFECINLIGDNNG